MHYTLRKTAAAVGLFLAVAFLLAVVPSVRVEAQPRTLVVPDDYSSLVSAVSDANSGDTILVKRGTYEGPVNQTIVIDKTLSVVGESAEDTIINLHPAYNVTWILTATFFSYSDAIAITANNCKLVNLTVMISNPGGFISAAGDQIQIIGNNIMTGTSTGVNVNGSYCNISDNVMGGRVQLSGSFNEVARNSLSAIYIDGSSNSIKDNVCGGIGLGYSNDTARNVVSGNRVTSSTRGFSGISLSNCTNNIFYKNHVSGFSYGFWLWFSSNNTITENFVADSLSGSICLGASSGNTFYLNNFVKNFSWSGYVYDHYPDPNYRQAYPNMTLSTNFWDNSKKGNYWENYNGTDSNGDGVGDSPYIINESNQDNYPLMEQVDIDVIPEFPSWTPLTVMVFVIMSLAFVYRRKLVKGERNQ